MPYNEKLPRRETGQLIGSAGILGAYSITKVATSQVRALVAKARSETVVREAREVPPRRPKSLDADIQGAIVDRYLAGRTMKALAAEMKVHRTTIRTVLDRHGIAPRDTQISDTDVARAAALYESGQSLATIGAQLGFNPQTISNRLRQIGVALRDPHGRTR
ncbi:helix-turn-helix domain-containing protein [Agromyces atrinae]|uniref:Lambda repressor-like predicted transcriptional regulator n=2 Tax=Agromyces atrinae TaxID=592376 RepID=A0A852SHU0_9MICO|nr:helix-turn-helix domain-containing protein [Agromyces atrinae]NYD68713.1 lambda repressor-like predicted transcriptional regulator [Agromyces atrinae]